MKKHLCLFLILSAMAPSAARSQKLLFDPPRGFYDTAFDLTITSPVEGATIKYTFNGEDPRTSPSAQSRTSPATVRIDPGSTAGRDRAPGVCVRAIALSGGQTVSNMSTHTYLFAGLITQLSPDNSRPGAKWPAPNSPVNGQEINYGMDPDVYNHSRYKDKILPAILAVPSFSMVIDLDSLFDGIEGIYVNAGRRGEEWERACSLELLHPDGSDGFHINCGVRIRGGYSRVPWNPKHAFRFFFRSRYGEARLEHALFENEGVDEFDKIDLACPQNYSWSYGIDDPEQNTFLRDLFSRDLQRDMGQPYTRSRYYHLYINGTYWGLFYTQERSEADYAASYFSGAPEDFDVIKVDAGWGTDGERPYIIEAADGTLDAYFSLWAIAQDGFENDAAYYRVQGLNSDGSANPAFPKMVDLDNLIDYMINTLWVGDFDAPISDFRSNRQPNNFYAIYNRVSPDGFKYFRHDAEHIMNVGRGVEIDRTGPYPAGQYQGEFNPQWLHQELCEHPEYRLRFADRVYKHFFNGGALTEEANTARVYARREQIDQAIIAESARWGDSKNWDPYTRDTHWIPAVDWILDTWIPQRNEIVLEQFRNKGWYPAVEPPAFNSRSAVVEKGFQLIMTAPSGKIYYTQDGMDPHNPFGGGGLRQVPLVAASAAKRVLVPSGSVSASWRSITAFDDSGWLSCNGAPGGIGYEKDSGYEGFITLDVADYMHQDDTAQPNASCLIRIPFDVKAEDLPQFSALRLSVRFDDGFVAYLN
ncbi:CotH kinase family protein, partial [bacterium]|nr:CotH kinase family protein [bacterium]